MNSASISPKYAMLLVGGTFLLSIFYWAIGTYFFNSPLSYFEYFELTILIAILILGGYQIFFWVQRHNSYFKTRVLKISLDDYIPFWPSWVWIYSFLYYVAIGYVLISVDSVEQAVTYIFGGIMLLLIQSLFFLFIPTVVPQNEWRTYTVHSLSTRYLKFIQTLDNGRNCFPSMHCSLATYIGLILLPTIGAWAYLFIALIAVSCLLVKQHQILDIPPGIIVGWLIFHSIA